MSSAPAPDRFILALAALVIGAIGMGFSPIFVRLADVGPFASAFWRVALALPVLYLWQRFDPPQGSQNRGQPTLPTILAGLAFAGDLVFWHLSILKTSVANATLLATMAPVWVFLITWLLFAQRIRRVEILGLAVCIAGGALLVRDSVQIDRIRLIGDMQALATSLFFGLYIVAVTRARMRQGTAQVMFQSTAITALCLLFAALLSGESFWPGGLYGWLVLAGLALVSQAAGQGLLTFALGRLPVAFSSLVVFLEAVAAAGLGWVLLAETLGLWQWLGGCLVLGGIWLARPGSQERIAKSV